MVGIAIGVGIKGVGDIMKASKSFESLKNMAKQTDVGIKGLSGTLASYRLNAMKLNNIRINQDNLKNQIFNMQNLLQSAAITLPIKAAMDFESAMADVNKVANFDDKKEAEQYSKEILSLSRSIPLSATELATITAAGGQLGIAKENLMEFTAVTAKMSTAFDMSAEEAGESMAKIMNVYQLNVKEAERLGDAMNHLSDNSASKAKNITEVLGRIGGNAKVFGLTGVQAAALGSSFVSLGKTPEVASTAINSLLTKLATAPKQGAEFQKALQKIGMDSVYLKTAIEENPQMALTTFLEALEKVDKKDQMGVFNDLMGGNFGDDLALLVGSLDEYKKALKLTANEGLYAGSMQKEFEIRSATTANQLQRLKNAMNEIAITIGSLFLPKVNEFLLAFTGATHKVVSFIENNKLLTKTIAGVAIGVFGFKIGFLAVSLVVSYTKGTILQLIQTKKALTVVLAFLRTGLQRTAIWIRLSAAMTWTHNTASKALALTQNFLRATFLSAAGALRIFRLALLATGIGAFIILAGVVIENWDKVKEYFNAFVSWLKPIFEPIAAWWSDLFGGIFSWLAEKFEWVSKMAGKATEIIKNIASFLGFGAGTAASKSDGLGANQEALTPAYAMADDGGLLRTPSAGIAGGIGNGMMAGMGGSINVTFSGDFVLQTKDGKVDLGDFESRITQSVRRALEKEQLQSQNRRITG